MSDTNITEEPGPDSAEQPADVAANEPVETEPGEAQPVETEPGETQPEETEPAEIEPAETEPAETEPVETEPAETEPGETQPVETEPGETEPVETEPAETEPVETEPVETQPVETQPVETEPVETEQAETEPGESGVQQPEPVAVHSRERVLSATDRSEQVLTAEEVERERSRMEAAPAGDEMLTGDTAEMKSSAEAELEKREDKLHPEERNKIQRESKQVGGDIPMEKEEKIKISPKDKVKKPVNLNANATVKFVLMPSGQVITLACTLGQTLKQLKEHFATELKMPFNLILLMYDGKTMPDETTLADLGVGPNGTVQLELQSADPINMPIKAYRPRQEYHMPDVITVRVIGEDGNAREVIVEIERTTRKKPYLGGYRHKETGIEFHNASAQTVKKQRPPPPVERYCRDTQTTEQWHRLQQTSNDMSTQMTKIGVYVANLTDKLIEPQTYITADEHLQGILQKIIILQKYYRRWLARKRVKKLKEDRDRRMEWERQEELRKRKEKEERIRKEFARRMNPKNKDDFDLLYHALEKWRLEEIERINSTLTGAERKAALYMLLDQETQLLSAIDRHKLEADDNNKKLRILTFLDKAASPKKWKGPDGKPTLMDTPFTIRARELKDIYNSINMKYLTQDERLDVLLTLKHTVKEHDCKLTQEIIELIDREADLLMRGVREGNLDGLRKRIATLFLQYIKTPTFNPEAAKLLKVPQDPTMLRKNIYFCSGCNNYLPSTEFPLSSNSRVVGKCRQCNKVDNDGRVRQDYSHYRYMLKMLRRSEEIYDDDSQIAFLLQESDLRYLVENIWSSQSTLSAWDDMFDLVLVRWDKHEEWSPWNCILLTKDEAEAHEKLESLEEGYGQVFIHKVKQKHTLARNYFSRLPGMAELVRKRASQKNTGTRGPSVAGTSVSVQQKA